MKASGLAFLGLMLTGIAAACGSSDGKKRTVDGSAGAASGGAPEAAAGASGAEAGAAGEGVGGAAAQSAGGGHELGGAGPVGGASPLGGANAMAGASDAGGAACDAPAQTLPDFATGTWLICGAMAENGRVWNGALTFDAVTSTCSGAKLSGQFHWVTTNDDGTTRALGTYDAATGLLTLNEYEVTGGNLVQATDTMTYDAETDTLVRGAWTCACSPGAWDSASHEAAGVDVDSCP